MKTNLRTMAKSFALVAAAIAVFTLGQGIARADDVTISGFTTGTITGVPQLTFTGNDSFTGTTAGGIGSLSGPNSLGTFTLNTDSFQGLHGEFTMNITFTSPTGINAGQSESFTATISGSVTPDLDRGGAEVEFITFNRQLTFSSATQTGSFDLEFPQRLFIQTGRSAQLTGRLQAQARTTVPEPATLFLLGTGLTGVAARLRKRKRAGEGKV